MWQGVKTDYFVGVDTDGEQDPVGDRQFLLVRLNLSITHNSGRSNCKTCTFAVWLSHWLCLFPFCFFNF